MGLNPGESPLADKLRRDILDDRLNGGSPYYDMYVCGYYGVPFEECLAKCARNGIALRKKDVDNYNNGVFRRGMGSIISNGMHMSVSAVQPGIPFDTMKLGDFPKMPAGWHGTENRFFPCTQDNRPMQPWGWKKDEHGNVVAPELYTRANAKALSPCGWVGQNMLYQKFIVMDIDGRGHGSDDLEVIEFGTRFKNRTFTLEDPAKPGSFHLYFETDRLIPVRHFTWAKLDLMGNAVNAAVYFKNKQWNGIPMMELCDEVWDAMMDYQKSRKERQHVS